MKGILNQLAHSLHKVLANLVETTAIYIYIYIIKWIVAQNAHEGDSDTLSDKNILD